MDTTSNIDPETARELAQAVAGAAGGELPGDADDPETSNVRRIEPRANTPRELQRFARENDLQVNAPARPELAPGESKTTEPERWCERCNQARGGRRCQVCRGFTVANVTIEEAPEYEPEPFRRARDVEAETRFDDEVQFDDEQEYDAVAGGDSYEEPSRFGRPQQNTSRARERGRGAPMSQQPRQQQQRQQQNRGGGGGARPRLRDVGGNYDEHDTPSRRGRHQLSSRHVRTAEQQLSEQWQMRAVNEASWSQYFAALLQGCRNEDDIAHAAELADAAYIELMARQQGG